MHIVDERSHDVETLASAATEIESFLDYEVQSGRLDDRTREAFVIALEVLHELVRCNHWLEIGDREGFCARGRGHAGIHQLGKDATVLGT